MSHEVEGEVSDNGHVADGVCLSQPGAILVNKTSKVQWSWFWMAQRLRIMSAMASADQSAEVVVAGVAATAIFELDPAL